MLTYKLTSGKVNTSVNQTTFCRKEVNILVNTQLLEDRISKSGFKPKYLYEQLGISRYAFYLKKKGDRPFRAAEIYVLSDLLNISAEEKQAIFFAN